VNALEVEGLTLVAGSFSLRDVSLTIGSGEYFVLMGRTGAGKSLLLKAICGLAGIAEGTIRIAGRDVTEKEPRSRDISYVPQDGGLFPHLSVLRNIIFPLTVRNVKKADAIGKVEGIIDQLQIEDLLSRSVSNLSGGERQKIALARALARRPALLVLDEPVCALDEPTRRHICCELRRVQKQFGVPTLHVCHSRDEAELVSDRVGIMRNGRMTATGGLKELANGDSLPAVWKLLLA